MDYYLNEYSLRGQFKDIDEFFESIRTQTFPVLQKIRQQQENVLWKKDTFWNSEICKGIFLNNIPKKKNERSSELASLQCQLIRLATENPFWESDSETNLKIKEYKFDEEYREWFEETNCFTKAIENEGVIISFNHPSYSDKKLPIIVEYNDSDIEYSLDNIYDISWWENEPKIRKWPIGTKYIVEVRAKEFEYHLPHFHVINKEYAAVFRLKDGKLYVQGNKKWTPHMISEVEEWYQSNKEELENAWNSLHPS